MKSVVFIFLLLWGIVYGWTLDGKIQPGEYTSNQELINTGNSTWYSFFTDDQICVAVSASGDYDVIVGITTNPDPEIPTYDNGYSSFWTGIGSAAIYFDTPVDYVVYCKPTPGVASCTIYDGVLVVTVSDFEFVTAWEICWYETNPSKTVYFQGQVRNSSSDETIAYAPTSGFYGFYVHPNMSAGLAANWHTYPYVANNSGSWTDSGTWAQGYIPADNNNADTYAQTHVVIAANVALSSYAEVAHMTQATNRTLTLSSQGGIGFHNNNGSIWKGSGKDFIAAEDAEMLIYTPMSIVSLDTSVLKLPSVELHSAPGAANSNFAVGGPWTAHEIYMVDAVNVLNDPTSVENLVYGSSQAFAVGKEWPITSGFVCSFYVSYSLSTPVSSVILEENALVSAYLFSTAVVGSLSIADKANLYLYPGISNVDPLPALNCTGELKTSGNGALHLQVKLYATELSDGTSINCLRSDIPLTNAQTEDEDWEGFPRIILQSEEDIDSEYNEMDVYGDTEVWVSNSAAFSTFAWYSEVEEGYISYDSRLIIPGDDDLYTVYALHASSSCYTYKSLDVMYWEDESKKSFPTALVGGVVGGVVVVAGVAGIAVFLIKRKNKKPEKENQKDVDAEMHDYTPSPRQSERQSTNQQPLIDPKYEIPYKEITFGPELGRGAFGVVFKCRWRNTDTVVKQMDINKSDKASVELFLKEAANVLKLRTHPNVCTVFGVCTDTQYPICILMEYLPDGSLDNLVYHNKIKMDAKLVLELARDIASGTGEVVYLICQACRNLLVTTQKDKHIVKIADFGLSRVTDKDTYNASVSATFPIRWTAPETLRSGKISRASDIWSFGVVLWEIIEGKRPYPELSNTEVMKAVCDKGYRLPCPDRIEIPPPLWHLMQDCWDEDPTQRPNFDTIYTRLDEMGKNFENQEEIEKKPQQQINTGIPTNYERTTEYSPEYHDGTTVPSEPALYGNQQM